MENKAKKRQLYWFLGILSLAVIFGIFVFLYFSSKTGVLPSLPQVQINEAQLESALSRLRKRSAKVKLESYHEELFAAYELLNEAEINAVEPVKRLFLAREFEEKNLISRTADKERYILFGDYLALKFEKSFFDFLKVVQLTSLEEALKDEGEALLELRRLSGSFLYHLIEAQIIDSQGNLLIPEYLPQLLFRKRWRILGGLPHRYQFLEVESLADQYFLLVHADKLAYGERIEAIRRIVRYQPEFDSILAEAIVYYEAKETKRALLLLESAYKNGKDDFITRKFILYLRNVK